MMFSDRKQTNRTTPNMKKTISTFLPLLVGAMTNPVVIIPTTAAIITLPAIVLPAPAQASFLSWLQYVSPSGAYAKINGYKLYFGSLNDESLLFSPDVTWQIQGQNGPIAKGYGRVSGAFVRGLYQFFFQPVRVE
jgi:hypothetical protein